MNMDEVGDAIPEAGGAEASDKADSAAGIGIVVLTLLQQVLNFDKLLL